MIVSYGNAISERAFLAFVGARCTVTKMYAASSLQLPISTCLPQMVPGEVLKLETRGAACLGALGTAASTVSAHFHPSLGAEQHSRPAMIVSATSLMSAKHHSYNRRIP